MGENCYRLLGLRDGASMDEIKAAYRRLVLLYHPDKNISTEDDEQFKAIAEAYRILRTNNASSVHRDCADEYRPRFRASRLVPAWLDATLVRMCGNLEGYSKYVKKTRHALSACEVRALRACEKILNGCISRISPMATSQYLLALSLVVGCLYPHMVKKGLEGFKAMVWTGPHLK